VFHLVEPAQNFGNVVKSRKHNTIKCTVNP